MKKLLVLLALCMVFSVALVACDNNTENPEETTAGSTEAPTTEETTEAPTTEPGSETEPPTTEETTEAPTTEETTTEETTEPPVVVDPVKVGQSFDECDMFIDGEPVGAFFTPGQSPSWDGIAVVEDYNVQAIRIWGWVAFYAETPGTFGYQIGDAEPVFDEGFSVEAEQPVVDAAVAQGGKSAARMKIFVPVRDLSGEVVIKALAKDAAGTIETITEFTMTKAVDPANPVVLFDAAAIWDTASGANTANHANQVGSAVLSDDGSYVTLTSAETGGDPWFMFRGVKVNAQYVAVKYRTTIANKQFHYFVASTGDNATGQGDMSDVLNYTADGEWHVAIIDISGVAAVNEENFISFLRYDFYTNGTSESIDVAWIGAFNSAEYAEAYFAKSMIIADNTNNFVTDVNSNESADFKASDIAGLMNLRPGTSGWEILTEGDAKYYYITGIDALTADMNGAYYFKVDAPAVANKYGVGFIVRGYNGTVSSDENVQYKVTNFYETDGAGFCGGSGIYAFVSNNTLSIYVKYYDAANSTRVGNKIYRLPCEGNVLTMADNGYTVSIMVDGVTYATIDLSGSIVYDDITTTPANGAFATKAVVTLKNGNTETIENTLVAATVNSQIGITCRASSVKIASVQVGGYSTIDVPALEIVLPDPVDPNAPIFVGDAKYLAQAAGTGNHIASAVVSEDGTYVTITSTDGKDPNFFVLNSAGLEGVKFIALKYRTTFDGEGKGGEFFVGSVSITGGADEAKFEYEADGEWHILIIDLSTVTTVNEAGLVNYLRYDFFMGAVNASIDVESIGLFKSENSLNKFYGIDAPVVVPEHKDVTVVLGSRDPAGGPFSGSPDKAFGQKVSLGDAFLKQISIKDLATYADKNQNTWSLKIWQWNSDYFTTVAAAPLFVLNGENHQDNATFVADIPVELLISGDIYYELEYLSGSGTFTAWPAADMVEGVESYVSGVRKDVNFAASIVVGVEKTGDEPEGPAIVDKTEAGLVGESCDSVLVNNDFYFGTDGEAYKKLAAVDNTITIKSGDILGFRGWIGFNQPMEALGVSVNGGEYAWGDYKTATEDGVLAAGGANASRYLVQINTTGAEAGTYTVTWAAKLADGTIVNIYTVTVIIEAAEDPTPEEVVVDVPQSNWAVTGHKPGITAANDATHGAMVAAGGIENGALLHQGYIGIGEIDLSKYSKVIISYGIDNSAVTIGHYDASANNRITLCKADAAFTNSPEEANIIAGTTYTLQGWKLVTIEIDLTGVDYNGPVFVTYDTLPGTFMLVGAIQFVA